MDARKRRVRYTGSGIKRLQRQKKKRGKFLLPRKILVFAAVLVVFAVLSLGWRLLSADWGRSSVGRVTRIGATVGQNIAAFGENVIFYDGATLRCISSSGGSTWSYQIGANANYSISGGRIAAWSGSDIFILNDRGRLLFNRHMDDTIQFAAVGDEYAAIFCGEENRGVIIVINRDGQTVDKITVNSLTLMNIGFFKAVMSASGTQQTELMWVLGLNTTGTVIGMELQTFQPGRLSIGKTDLGDHLAYSVYSDGTGNLDVVTTREIQHYNYRGVSTGNASLIYGYSLHDVKQRGQEVWRLLIPEQETSRNLRISGVRVMNGTVDRMLHLPVSCLDARLGTRAVYGFSENAVYACRFGETTFRSYALPINITSVLDMMEGNRAVVASGSEIYIVELPL